MAFSLDNILPFLLKTVSLSIHPSSVIGEDFSRIKITSIVDYTDVDVSIMDPRVMHNRVRSHTPDIPSDYREYLYVKYVNVNGSVGYIGVPWIVEDSIALVTNRLYTVKVQSDAVDATATILNALSRAGLTNVTITST